jgi:8-oxo-dGTP diphosphatase
MQENRIRNAVRAIIIEDGKILLCKYKDKDGVYYACVGGGQDCFEDMHTALRRECKEEINSEINIGEMVFVRDAIFNNFDGSSVSKRIHQIEYFFRCTLKNTQDICVGDNPDYTSIGVEWLPLEKLKEIRIFPNIFKDYIHPDGSLENVLYLGLTN